jgi:hypothetical protein
MPIVQEGSDKEDLTRSPRRLMAEAFRQIRSLEQTWGRSPFEDADERARYVAQLRRQFAGGINPPPHPIDDGDDGWIVRHAPTPALMVLRRVLDHPDELARNAAARDVGLADEG